MSEDRLEKLEARLRQLEDREEIRDFIARYGFISDLGLDREYVDMFVEDGAYVADDDAFRGHDELWTYISDPNSRAKTQVAGRGSQHTSLNIVVDVDGDTAWAECYSTTFVRTTPTSWEIFQASYNHWDFTRVDGRWKIVLRRRSPVGSYVHNGGPHGLEVMTEFRKALPEPTARPGSD